MKPTPRLLISIACLLSLLVVVAGCNVLGVAAQAVVPDESKAKFVPEKRTTVVVAERYANPAQSAMDDEPLARYVTDDLREQNVVPLVDSDRVYTLRRSMSAQKWHAMTVDAVGRAVNADQIIYVNLLDLNVEVAPGTGMMTGQGTALVRLVDAHSGRTIWPSDAADGWPVSVSTPMQRMNETSVNEPEIRATVLRAMADQTAKLFYTYSRN